MNNTPTWLQVLVPLVQAFSPIVQIALVIVGWFFIARDNRKREVRKEIRTLIDSIEKKLVPLEKNAYKYYRTAVDDSRDIATSLRRELQRLSMTLVVLTHLDKAFDTAEQMKKLRQSITGNDFDSAQRPVRDASHPICENITIAADALAEEMETAYAKLFS